MMQEERREGGADDGTPTVIQHAIVISGALVDQNHDPQSSASSRPNTERRVNDDDDLPVAVRVPPPSTATSTNIHSLVTDEEQEDEDRANSDEDMPEQKKTIRNKGFRILLGLFILIVAIAFITPSILLGRRQSPQPQCHHIVKLDVGFYHTCIICRDDSQNPPRNELVCWGDNSFGQISAGDYTRKTEEVLIPTIVSSISNPVDVALGDYDSCAITSFSNQLYCWGSANVYHGCGNCWTPSKPQIVSIDGDPITGVKKVALGNDHRRRCIISQADEVFCWGINDQDQWEPKKISINGDQDEYAVEIALGNAYSCVITNLQFLWCWGKNDYGKLGNGSEEDVSTPTRINLPDTEEGKSQYAVKVSCGWNHSCAISTEGNLLCWGRNFEGQIGTGSNLVKYTTPVGVTFPSQISYPIEVSLGDYHTCAVVADELQQESIYCWGSNYEGQIGDGTTTDELRTPTLIIGAQSSNMTVALGYAYTCATLHNGQSLYCWGKNDSGQLGDGDWLGYDRHYPTKIF